VQAQALAAFQDGDAGEGAPVSDGVADGDMLQGGLPLDPGHPLVGDDGLRRRGGEQIHPFADEIAR